MRFVVNVVCGVGACAGVVSWGDSGSLGVVESGNSLT